MAPFESTTKVSVPAAGMMMKRKTPLELRQEQLSRKTRVRSGQDEATSALSTHELAGDQKKTGPRLVDTRVADIFAATKPKFPSPKQQDGLKKALSLGSIECSQSFRSLLNAQGSTSLPARKPELAADDEKPSGNGKGQTCEKSKAEFRDVTQLTSRPRPQNAGLPSDLAATLKVLEAGKCLTKKGTRERSNLVTSSDPLSSSLDPDLTKSTTSPVDLSLKLSARFVSSDSLHWCHRTTSKNEAEGLKMFVEKYEWKDTEDLGCGHVILSEKGMTERFGARFCQSLHSWVYPQPQYMEVYAVALASTRGDVKESPMVTSLHRMWEESFRSLYYMFSHNRCKVFYYCTQQSVVMFHKGNNEKWIEDSTKAYWTRSTRGLRKKLEEHGVEFSMPLCTSDADKSTLEDLNELTEFEKSNPGQTRLVDPKISIDNSSQSLLQFEGGSVHYLFDFLLNYRFLVSSANASDFPVLYSPVEFSQASLYKPEVRCKKVQHLEEHGARDLDDSQCRNLMRSLYSLELKSSSGAYIPPWVIQDVSSVLEKSQKHGCEVSFVTSHLSETLNVAQEDSPNAGASPSSEELNLSQ